MQAVNAADLSKPIILNEDGELLDGRHRIMKALLVGHSTIKAVRFDENPSPCKYRES
jgi:ParB-like chromosome segregation protein Spo0J